ncbi:MAG: hypothetical protein ACREI9_12590 [Nitrospiraceae bacterium]
MGEAETAPDTAARVIEDPTAMEVDPAKGERLYRAALIHTSTGTAYRMLAKSLKTGKLDLVHYGCQLDEHGKPTTKWRIRRILEQSPERFDKEIEAIKKAVADDGESVAGAWTLDLAPITDLTAQGKSLDEWSRKIAAEITRKPS